MARWLTDARKMLLGELDISAAFEFDVRATGYLQPSNET